MISQIQFSLLNGIKQGSTSIFSAISVIVLFVLILFGAYFTTRFMGKYQSNRHRNSHIKIIEALQVGPGKTVQLLKVGDEFILIGVTKERITSLKTVSKDGIDLTLVEEKENQVPFEHYLSKFKSKKNKESNDENYK
jgi:flagellar protein FliO/FliZ